MSSNDENAQVKVESSTNEMIMDEDTRPRRFPPKFFNRNQRPPRRRPNPFHRDGEEAGSSGMQYKDKFMEKIQQLSGPSFDLPLIEAEEKKFCGRNRLYIGNTGTDLTEEDLNTLFKPYGEIGEIFINKDKNFAFVKYDYHANALKAKNELDGYVFKSRNLKIRFAPSCSTVKVKNLSPYVSNELLYHAFRIFGEIERAIVLVDERGRSKGEGLIDFVRKGCALQAIQKCKDGCFFLTGALRPCIVEPFETSQDNEGLPEKAIPKRNNSYVTEREIGPSYYTSGNFKYEYGQRWKILYELYQEKEIALKKEFEMEKNKLEAQMEYIKYEHETEQLREQLRYREMDRERQKREWELKEQQMEEQRRKIEETVRAHQEEIENTMRMQEENVRARHQENKMYIQKQQSKEASFFRDMIENRPPPPLKDFEYESPKGSSIDLDCGYQGNSNHGYWVNEDNMFNKRRRYQ